MSSYPPCTPEVITSGLAGFLEKQSMWRDAIAASLHAGHPAITRAFVALVEKEIETKWFSRSCGIPFHEGHSADGKVLAPDDAPIRALLEPYTTTLNPRVTWDLDDMRFYTPCHCFAAQATVTIDQ